MCRNIRTLFHFEPPTTTEEIEAAALQYVRKISGIRKPSARNAEAFARAVREVTETSARMLETLERTGVPRTREGELARARKRGEARVERSRLIG